MPNYYDNDEAAPEGKPTRPSEEGMDEKRGDEDAGSPVLIPKDCGEYQPGDTITLKVNQSLDDQYECSVVHGEQKEPEGGEGMDGPSAEAPKGEFASMMD